jgi:hypothetical protein
MLIPYLSPFDRVPPHWNQPVRTCGHAENLPDRPHRFRKGRRSPYRPSRRRPGQRQSRHPPCPAPPRRPSRRRSLWPTLTFAARPPVRRVAIRRSLKMPSVYARIYVEVRRAGQRRNCWVAGDTHCASDWAHAQGPVTGGSRSQPCRARRFRTRHGNVRVEKPGVVIVPKGATLTGRITRIVSRSQRTEVMWELAFCFKPLSSPGVAELSRAFWKRRAQARIIPLPAIPFQARRCSISKRRRSECLPGRGSYYAQTEGLVNTSSSRTRSLHQNLTFAL